MGGGDVTGRSNVRLKMDEWYQISASFSSRYAYILVRDQTGVCAIFNLRNKDFSGNQHVIFTWNVLTSYC